MANKSVLNEYCQKNGKEIPRYHSTKDCEGLFFTDCTIAIGEIVESFQGKFSKKKDLEDKAALEMLEHLKNVERPNLREMVMITKKGKEYTEKNIDKLTNIDHRLMNKADLYIICYDNSSQINKFLSESPFIKGHFHIFLTNYGAEDLDIDNYYIEQGAIEYHRTNSFSQSDVSLNMTWYCSQNYSYFLTYKKVKIYGDRNGRYLATLLKSVGINAICSEYITDLIK